MPSQRMVVLMGSKSDLNFAHKVEEFLKQEGFSVNCEYVIASAHRAPDYLLKRLDDDEKKGDDDVVYVTIAGMSDALSGVTAGFTTRPVIACPPDIEKYGPMKVFSSVMTPTGVPVMLVSKPENAALAAIKILALNNPSLRKEIAAYIQRKRKESVEANSKVTK
ncbi:AIR carboxylase family protein [Candidatus Bathyarchaeota archaeon]|nr:AIR carboxylase family protein [Candidatus Bathyarchaeota archaeon]